MTSAERVANYNRTFRDFPCMWHDKGWIMGVWNIGNNYKGSGYHGAYPPGYLKRIMSLFPEKKNVLHLCSGSVKDANATTFDIRPELNPDICGDAERLASYTYPMTFDLILADVPYTGEDAAKYGQPLLNRNKVVEQCAMTLRPGGHLCWMDMVLPMYRKTDFSRIGHISIERSTNHRVRAVMMFERKPAARATPEQAKEGFQKMREACK